MYLFETTVLIYFIGNMHLCINYDSLEWIIFPGNIRLNIFINSIIYGNFIILHFFSASDTCCYNYVIEIYTFDVYPRCRDLCMLRNEHNSLSLPVGFFLMGSCQGLSKKLFCKGKEIRYHCFKLSLGFVACFLPRENLQLIDTH